MYDCIIVGAGPAGGSAAYHLAKGGHSVLVLEKESLPRYKPCGGGVSPIVGQWFDFDFSPAISVRATTIRYTWQMEDPVEVDLNTAEPIWMVRRDIFDHYLIQQAQRQGAELRDAQEVTGLQFEQDHWQVKTAAGTYGARFLIAADGAKGPLAKWLGFKARKRCIGGALEGEALTPVTQEHIAHFEFGMVPNGYLWNFPKADGYSIGIGTFQGGRANAKPPNLREIVARYSQLFNVDFTTIHQQGHPLCLWNGDQVLHTQQALLAGEAACVVDPFTAEGIRPSIFSGIRAAEAIHAALGGDLEALDRYSQVMAEEWGRDMQWAQRLAGVFYRLPKVAYGMGIKRPSATRRIGQVLCGELRYGDVAENAIRRLTGGLLSGVG
ncbi:geranylgeranyl reductase family protein [Lyngbya confervoides]|uniref:Geranylgeranyl reductase family protein n=1 Tax=Lyngbya confervoides BDU141951 TaxID=1574623 RepID=A0ABD4SZL1_9CYAN|nr:geranylgeranyl reductase family protein [Lyngbya confervoides]MCM1981492.1 geranylgeranyl reductase family protein [Lyngbya confervoides BDU141951]